MVRAEADSVAHYGKPERFSFTESRRDIPDEAETQHKPDFDTDVPTMKMPVMDEVFEVFDVEGNWTCHNCSGQFLASESIGRHLFTCLKLQSLLPVKSVTVVSDKYYNGDSKLDTSIENSTRKPVFSCKHCSKSFYTKRSLEIHMIVHSTAKPFTCTSCGFRFKRKDDKVRHERKKSCGKGPFWKFGSVSLKPGGKLGPFECRNCNALFKSRRTQRRHEKDRCPAMKTKPWPMPRTNIGLIPKSKSGVSVKLQKPNNVTLNKSPKAKAVKYEGKKLLRCEQCSRAFISRKDVRNHMSCHPTSLSETSHKCDTCQAQFKRRGMLMRHIDEMHSTVNAFECSVCKAGFKQSVEVQVHMRIHRKTYPCPKCHRLFITESALQRHSALHSAARPFPCSVCSARFNQKGQRKIHELSHGTGRIRKPYSSPDTATDVELVKEHASSEALMTKIPKIHSCKLCSKEFRKRSNLNNHMPSHSDIRPFPCKYCGIRFKLKKHKQRHEQNKSCGKRKLRKPQKATNRIHEKSTENPNNVVNPVPVHSSTSSSTDVKVAKEPDHCHPGSRTKNLTRTEYQRSLYSCKLCSKEFPNRSKFSKHMFTHSNIRPFPCTYCGSRFKSNRDKLRHEQNKSCGKSKGRSKKCTKVIPFARPKKANINAPLLRCDQCAKTFAEKRSLERHILLHPAPSSSTSYECDTCKARFKCRASLTKHIQEFHVDINPFVCTVCQASFKEASELHVHVGTHRRNYVCPDCSKTFSKESSLQRHSVLHSAARPFPCSICNVRFNSTEGLSKHERSCHFTRNRTRRNNTRSITVTTEIKEPDESIVAHTIPEVAVIPEADAKLTGIEIVLTVAERNVTVSETDFTLSETNVTVSNAEVIVSETDVTVSDTDVTVSDADVTVFDADVTVSDADVTVSDADVAVSDVDVTVSDADVTVSDADVTVSDADVTVSDADVTVSDADVTVSDADVTVSDADVTVSETDVTVSETDITVSRVTVSDVDVTLSDTEVIVSDADVTVSDVDATVSDADVMVPHANLKVTETIIAVPQTENHVTLSDPNVTAPHVNTKVSRADKRRKKSSNSRDSTSPEWDPQSCEKCSKVFSSKRNLREHKLLGHSTARHSASTKCGALVKQNEKLTKHTKSQKPYICVHCGIGFSRRDRLTNHVEKHTTAVVEDSDRKAWKCVYNGCQKSFTRQLALINHARKHVPVEQPKVTCKSELRCSFCQKEFTTHQKLKVHIMKTHKVGEKAFPLSTM